MHLPLSFDAIRRDGLLRNKNEPLARNNRCFNRSKEMNIFYLIGVVVVVIVVAGYLGVHL